MMVPIQIFRTTKMIGSAVNVLSEDNKAVPVQRVEYMPLLVVHNLSFCNLGNNEQRYFDFSLYVEEDTWALHLNIRDNDLLCIPSHSGSSRVIAGGLEHDVSYLP